MTSTPPLFRSKPNLNLRYAITFLATALLLTAALNVPSALAQTLPVRPESDRLTPEQTQDLNLMLGLLRDPQLDVARRRDAAASLMLRGWPAAIDALAVEFRQTDDPVTRRAIAAAAASINTPPPGLIQPMLEALQDPDPQLQTQLADALGRFENHGVTEKLIALAADTDAPQTARLGATRALAEHRTRQSVDTLLQITDPAEPLPIRTAAFNSLQQLTGIKSFATDRDAWQKWWQTTRDLPRDRWLARLVQSLSEKNKKLGEQQTDLENRLTDTLNRLYIAQDEAQRSVMLSEMLDDEMPAVRLLALRLIERKILNAQPISQPVRRALRRHLIDPAPAVRATTALRLRDLDDEPAMAIALQQLLGDEDPAVQNAYLSLLTRNVTADAVEPALILLARPDNRAAAAELLIAAHTANLISDPQAHQACDALRTHLTDNTAPNPAAIRLLGQLAEEQDHTTLAALLDHEAAPVRAAAVDTFTNPAIPLAPLLAKLDSPLHTDGVIQTVSRRAVDLPTAIALTRHTPASDAQAQLLRSALIAIAQHLAPADLLQLDTTITDNQHLSPIRPDILKRAPELPTTDAARPDLLLRLARLHLDTDHHDAAQTIYNELDTPALNNTQRQHHALGMIEIDLHADRHDTAVQRAEQLYTDQPDLAPVLANLLLDAAQDAINKQQTEQAAAMIGHTQRILGDNLPAPARQKLEQIRKLLPTPQAAVDSESPGS